MPRCADDPQKGRAAARALRQPTLAVARHFGAARALVARRNASHVESVATRWASEIVRIAEEYAHGVFKREAASRSIWRIAAAAEPV